MDIVSQNRSRSFSAVVAGKWFGKILENGVPQKTIENRSNICLEQLTDVDARIPLLDFQQLIKCSYELVEDETLALQVGAAATPEEMGIIGYMLLNCQDLVEMVHVLVKYSRLLTNMDVQLTEKKDHLALEVFSTQSGSFEIDNDPLIRYRVESTIAWIVTILRYFNQGMKPYELFFKHSRPGYQRAYHDLFETSLHFNQPTNMMLFHKKDLEVSSGMSNPYLLTLYKRHAERLLQELQQPESLEQHIERIISANLDDNTVNLDMVADHLHMNRWKLARLLKERCTTFQQIHDDARFKLAKSYLKNRQVQISEIHELLGYSDPSAFTRAFKRWGGMSPRDFRRQFSLQPPAAYSS